MKKYDVCVIGGGPSGYAAAMRALDLKKRVILIEKDKLGGAGVYNGALSSKTFWELAKDAASYRKNTNKFGKGTYEVNFKEVIAEVFNAQSERNAQLQNQIDIIKNGNQYGELEFLQGFASLVSKNEVKITNGGNSETIFASNIVLATGSRPRKLTNIPIDEKIIFTSDGVNDLTQFPESMVILGAGVIGCEFATIFSNFGYTKVNIIDKTERILPFEDPDVSSVIEKNLEDNGVHIHRNSQLVRMEIKNGKVEYELEYKGGKKEVFVVEKALVSVGRVPNIESLGLEQIGVKLTERGGIADNDTQTDVPNIYAVGDLTADIALVNVGELEGRHAVEKMYGKSRKVLSHDNISTIMFLSPEVSGVGINETEAQRRKIPYKVVSLNYSTIPRAIAMRNKDGFFKILVTNDKDLKILGMRAVGVHASSAIQAVALLISMNKGVQELAELIHPHPSIIEGVQECVRMLLGKSILKPQVFRESLSCKAYIDGKYEDLVIF
jgi:dihydrolipoamide dehydrogenase